MRRADPGWRTLAVVALALLLIVTLTAQGSSNPGPFRRDGAANTWGVWNGANAQRVHIYGFRTDASNYERLTLRYNAGSADFYIQTEAAGTGVVRHLYLGTSSLGWFVNSTTPHLLAAVDNAHDIGASGATRPKDYWGAGRIISQGATAGIGYGTGAGGTVTQLTNKATGVTLNKVTGEITMNGAALAADTTVSFTWTNSAIATGDHVICHHVSTGTQGAYNVTALAASGSATVNVRNVTPGSLSEAIVLKCSVVRSATS